MNVISNRQLPCDKSSMIQTVLMDSDLAWVNGKSGRQSWRYHADAFQRSIISEAIYHFYSETSPLVGRLVRVLQHFKHTNHAWNSLWVSLMACIKEIIHFRWTLWKRSFEIGSCIEILANYCTISNNTITKKCKWMTIMNEDLSTRVDPIPRVICMKCSNDDGE